MPKTDITLKTGTTPESVAKYLLHQIGCDGVPIHDRMRLEKWIIDTNGRDKYKIGEEIIVPDERNIIHVTFDRIATHNSDEIEIPSLSNLKDIAREAIIAECNIMRRGSWSIKIPNYNNMVPDWGYTAIAVHHSGTWGRKQPEDIERFHIEKKGFDDIGYHYLINNAGVIYEGRDIMFEGAHIKSENSRKIGILVLGDFERDWWDVDDKLTGNQLWGLERLVICLKKYFPITQIGGHRDWAHSPTECPGSMLYKELPSIRLKVGLNEPPKN